MTGVQTCALRIGPGRRLDGEAAEQGETVSPVSGHRSGRELAERGGRRPRWPCRRTASTPSTPRSSRGPRNASGVGRTGLRRMRALAPPPRCGTTPRMRTMTTTPHANRRDALLLLRPRQLHMPLAATLCCFFDYDDSAFPSPRRRAAPSSTTPHPRAAHPPPTTRVEGDTAIGGPPLPRPARKRGEGDPHNFPPPPTAPPGAPPPPPPPFPTRCVSDTDLTADR